MLFRSDKTKEILKKEVGWIDYGKKHNESIFTKFFQCYILPTKFGIDKRHAHLSNLICSGKITRDEAIAELQKPLYDPVELEATKKEILEKCNMSQEEFDRVMALPRVEHNFFPSDKYLFDLTIKAKSYLVKLGVWKK